MWLLDYFAAHKCHMLDFSKCSSDVKTIVMPWVYLSLNTQNQVLSKLPTPEIHPNQYPLVTLSLPVNECTHTYQFPRHQHFKELPDAQLTTQQKLNFKYNLEKTTNSMDLEI